MDLININCSYPDDPDFHPQTPAQFSSCTPVVDFHHLRWDQHCSERFQTNAPFLGSTYKEKLGFGNLEYDKLRKADSPKGGPNEPN